MPQYQIEFKDDCGKAYKGVSLKHEYLKIPGEQKHHLDVEVQHCLLDGNPWEKAVLYLHYWDSKSTGGQ